MVKRILAGLLCSLLLFGASCSNNTDSETTSASETTTETTTDTTQRETTTKPEPPPKRIFDKEDVYRHVFENHAPRINEEELDTLEVDHDSGEAVLYFGLVKEGMDWGESDSWNYTYYQVDGVTTALSGNCSKYQSGLIQPTSSVVFSDLVVHDYHEAYLDVMFEHLTFTECDALPNMKDGVYHVGWIVCEGEYYYVYSDGYLYYTTNDHAETPTHFRSEQMVDAAYLSVILFTSHAYSFGDDFPNENKYAVNEAIEIPEPYETKIDERYSTTGEKLTTTYYVTEDGTAYRVFEPSWTIFTDDFEVEGAVGFYVRRANIYPNAEKQGLWN